MMEEYQDNKADIVNESVVRYPSAGRRTAILKRVSWKSGMLYFLTLLALTGCKSLAFYGTYGTTASSTCWGREKASSLVVVPSRTKHGQEVSSRYYNGIEELIASPLHNRFSRISIHTIRGGHVRANLLPAAVASLVSGSVAGAIGVGIAFPLDTLKTKVREFLRIIIIGTYGVINTRGKVYQVCSYGPLTNIGSSHVSILFHYDHRCGSYY